MSEQRTALATALQAAWVSAHAGSKALAGPVLEAHCWAQRSEHLSPWDQRLLPPQKLHALRQYAYGRQACRLLAALQTPRVPAHPADSDVFSFLDRLEADAVSGRPHEVFLKHEAAEQARVAAAVAESKASKSGGFLKCRKCASTDVDTDAKQLRSADEPMTVFASCNGCGSRWTLG